ncbi:hypothetical protein E2562_027289 [Oryza meyeriana var. granulata]|uniref:NB-ARC domain-containing protein n=1 Tax=Oryza meyeriana var. granulata TaxID=110450 RepID=A0A6G1CAD2_9ORYZ|nr:hypothetical protein E2562_027289 [Oryza meyeriana var. granulata]
MEAPTSASLGAMLSLLRKLHDLLAPESQLIKPLKDGIDLLKQDLERVHAAMVELSETETPTKMASHWMNEVRDLSYDIEDYIGNTMHSYSNSGADLESIDCGRIGEFGASVRDARQRHEIYGLGRCTSRFTCVQIPAPNWKGTSLVGIEKSKIELTNKLTNDAEPQLKVVSILGCGGIGKTALAKQVFRELGGRFECRAFVQASRMPDTKRLLRSMLSQVRRHSQLPADRCTVQDLIDNICGHIQDKRYFIVIDDLWETTSWDIVNSAFPKGHDCSRILMTTAIEDIALECCDYQCDDICKMKPISRDDSANLFFNSVFGSEQNCSEQLREVSSEIVRNCGGLPLGIINIARLLASEMDNLELWCHVQKYLSSSMATNHTSEDILRNIVRFSYKSLPRHLKTCLQYLTMYPEGCIICKADLVKQWAAEGFIRETKGEDANAVADSYFDELVSKGMVQPNNRTYSDEVLSCTVHHMVFDVIKDMSVEENFTTAVDYSQPITRLPFKVRRLSLHVSNTKYATKPAHISLSQARSLNFYGLAECLPSTLEFKQLRVLILEFWGDQEEFDLRGIFRLFQLRYVQVTTDMIVKLPATIQSLQYLETLQLNARVANVPSDIVYLPKLLHFRLRDVTNLPDNIGRMVSLCTLESLDLSNISEQNVWGLGEMMNLQDLQLNCSTELSGRLKRNLTALASSLGKFGKLRTLILAPSGTSMYMDCSSSVSSPPLSLQRLELLPPICIFSRLPKWIGQLKRLCILKIVVRELLSNDVHGLTMLPELTVLSLNVQQSTEETIVFNRKAFPVLKYFKFRCGVLRIAFQAEAMPNLQKLKIEFNAHRGEQYGDMLTGIEHLLKLQEIIGRIGAPAAAEESDKKAAESALSDATKKHSRIFRFNIRWINWVEEEVFMISDPPERSSRSDEEKQKANEQDATNKPSGTEIVIEDSSFSREPSYVVSQAYQVEIESTELADASGSLSHPTHNPRRKHLPINFPRNCADTAADRWQPRRESVVPKFGEWDSTTPEAGERFTGIFSRVREEKQSQAGKPSGFGNDATHRHGKFSTRHKDGYTSKKLCTCFGWCR